MTSERGNSQTRRALVTGASRGLGLTLARLLADLGYQLVLTARGEEDLERARKELTEKTVVSAVSGDVRDEGHLRALAEACSDRLDLLVNNASSLGTSPLPPLLEYDYTALSDLFAVNTFAPLQLTRQLQPLLASAEGWVINISSDAARGAYPRWGGYGMSKAALELQTRTLAAEVPEITFVSVDPGDMRTQMHQRAFPGEDIGDRPLPQATLPFWTWLLSRQPEQIDGLHFEAQGQIWEVTP